MRHPRPNIAVDIVAIATEELARNRKEVVFYFLARILENEERESRRKKVKDTPLSCKDTTQMSLILPLNIWVDSSWLESGFRVHAMIFTLSVLKLAS